MMAQKGGPRTSTLLLLWDYTVEQSMCSFWAILNYLVLRQQYEPRQKIAVAAAVASHLVNNCLIRVEWMRLGRRWDWEGKGKDCPPGAYLMESFCYFFCCGCLLNSFSLLSRFNTFLLGSFIHPLLFYSSVLLLLQIDTA